MGAGGLRRIPQVLIVGPEGAGKTTLVQGENQQDIYPTQGYNRVEKSFLEREHGGKVLSVWDISGKEALKPLWSSYYKNILYSAVIFVIDPNDKEKFDTAIKDLNYLTNEEELRDSVFLVLFNMKSAKGNTEGRDKKELEVLIKRHEMHLHTKIDCYEFNFKGYNETAKQAFEKLYSNLNR